MDEENTHARTIIVTGGTSGIGLEAIRALLCMSAPRPPWRIIAGARASDPGLLLAAQKSATLKNDTVEVVHLDLREYNSVRNFAAHVLENVKGQIDILVLCAGTVCASRRITADGEEETMQVNALSHALLLDLLWPRLHTAVNACRIVFVASGLHLGAAKAGRLKPGSFEQYRSVRDWTSMHAYADSKLLMMHLFFITCQRAEDDAKQLGFRGVTVLAASPGFVPQTGLVREYSLFFRFASHYLLPLAPFATVPLKAGGIVADAAIAPTNIRTGTYLSRRGGMRAAEECYRADVRHEWETVLRRHGVWSVK